MKKIMAVIKNKDAQKILASAAIYIIGATLLLKTSSAIDVKYGAEKIIQTAEKMQPGFREALKEFVKSEYGLK